MYSLSGNTIALPENFVMYTVRSWAKRYREMNLAICRIEPGQKMPKYPDWTLRSLEPDEFHEADGLGIQAGRLSGDLVNVDIDSAEALAQADRLLPPTRMTEGRPGKPRSHRSYRVKDIPPEFTAPASAAGGIGGPRTRRLRGPQGMIVELGGTGSQVVAPPSIWTSKDGQRQERRAWAMLEGPTVIDCRELYEAVFRLGRACGWQEKTRPAREKEPHSRRDGGCGGEGHLAMPTGEAARQARQYLARVPPAVAGKGGNNHTFKAAATLVIDFGLSPVDALPVLLEWNRRCSPPWTVEDLKLKLAGADALERDDRGWRVRKRNQSIIVNVLPECRDVFVGVDVAAVAQSYVDLFPSLYAGLVRTATGWELAPELASVLWQGRHVLLAPASTITTNKREVWEEFRLARLLRERGAEVKSLRLPPLNGRRRTLAEAADVDWEVVDPPQHHQEAARRAQQAGEEARRLDAHRRRFPRKKGSPKLDRAMEFIRAHKVTSLTKDVLGRARRKGITRDTLWRALRTLYP